MNNICNRLLDALNFASQKHKFQKRKGKDGIPYINHCIQVAYVLSEVGGESDTVLLQAALLHDTVEDTDTSFEELEKLFGKEVSDLVREVTDDMSLPKAERKKIQVKTASVLSDRAKLIRISDKICNITDIERTALDWPMERKLEYFEWATCIVKECRGLNEKLEIKFKKTKERAVKAFQNDIK